MFSTFVINLDVAVLVTGFLFGFESRLWSWVVVEAGLIVKMVDIELCGAGQS